MIKILNYIILGMEHSSNNNVDAIIVRTAIYVAGIIYGIYRRGESDIRLAIPPALRACGMEHICRITIRRKLQ